MMQFDSGFKEIHERDKGFLDAMQEFDQEGEEAFLVLLAGNDICVVLGQQVLRLLVDGEEGVL
jgi:hypothetical protein